MQISDVLKTATFKKGDYIIKEGEMGDVFYILEEGECEVPKHWSLESMILLLKNIEYMLYDYACRFPQNDL